MHAAALLNLLSRFSQFSKQKKENAKVSLYLNPIIENSKSGVTAFYCVCTTINNTFLCNFFPAIFTMSFDLLLSLLMVWWQWMKFDVKESFSNPRSSFSMQFYKFKPWQIRANVLATSSHLALFSKLVCGHLSPCWGPPPQWGFLGSLRSPWLRCWRSTSWGTRRQTRLWLLAPAFVPWMRLEGGKTLADVGNELQWRERQGWKDLFLKYKRREHPVRGDENPHISAHSLWKIQARCWRHTRTRAHTAVALLFLEAHCSKSALYLFPNASILPGSSGKCPPFSFLC